MDRYVVKPAPARTIFDALEQATRARQPGAVPQRRTMPDEAFVLKQYSEALVAEVEAKNV